MTKTTPHSAALIASARRHLAPLGVNQRGRSRFWYDDRGWFLIGIEFQPSSFDRGSYLNVGCCWLWCAKPDFSFDLGNREEAFRQFTSPSDWGPVADGLAQRASELVQHYRSQFSSVADLAAHYEHQPPANFWNHYHAAIAYGLTNRIPQARHLFRTATADATSTSPQWLKDAAERCARFNAKLADRGEFRGLVKTEIERARRLMKLPPVVEPIPPGAA